MKNKSLIIRLFALVAAMMCALGASAAEAYANYTPSNTTLTFYYDNLRSTRTGTTYDLNTGSNDPGWYTDGTYSNVTKVVFNSSFASARPTTTYYWFGDMSKLQSITGTQYFNTSQVTNMCLMFAGAGAMMPNLDANFLNTSNVKTMESMFANSEFTSIIVSDWNTSEVTNMLEMFAFCYNLTSLDLSNFNTSKVTTMEGMFNEDYILVSLDLSNWNTSNVTNMNNMFHECNALTSVDLSSFNTAKVTAMYSMFDYCTSLTSLDLSSFNTSKVTDMRWMFSSCSKLTTIYAGSGWSTAATTDSNSDGMFRECTKIRGGQGTTYDASHTNRLYARIDGGPSNPGYFTAASEPYACYTESNTTLTFYYDNQRSSRTGTTYDLNTGGYYTDWDTDGTKSNVTKVVFDPSFVGARPTTTYDWFYGMVNLQTIVGMNYLNTSEVTNMGLMFSRCQSLTSLDLSGFNTSQVTIMSSMFYKCTNLRTIYVGNGWSTAAVASSSNMFYNCNSLVGGQGTTYDENHVNKTYAHIDGGPSNPGYFTEFKEAYACYTPSNTTLTFYYDNQRASRSGTTYDLNTGTTDVAWDTDGTNASVTKVVFDSSFAGARPTTTYDWFYSMRNLQSITGLSYLNTSEVTNMAWMFGYCAGLTSLDLSHFNTSKVTNMGEMFYGCSSLTSLDLSSFNTAKVTKMGWMFFDCTSLRTIYVGNDWSTAAVTNSTDMFYNCTRLVGSRGTTYNSSNPMDKTYAHIDGGPSNPGYFTAKNAGLRGDVNDDGSVNISDVTALIDYLLSNNVSGINLDGADCNQDSSVNISDVTTLIDYLLSGFW
ncbi:MAG: BspA family leucine-rich repeat surface protein [Muribaculaceae bacterium]|nr:BspA family leucine-rich repeat surface protein [Muribaculaceae bacterium]